MADIEYSCTKGKDGKLYVFKKVAGSPKRRTKNEDVKYCNGFQIEPCKRLCSAKSPKSPSRKANLPCKKKKAVFTNKKEVGDYCKSKVRGDYRRRDRQQIADIYNMVHRGEISEEEGDKLLAKVRKEVPVNPLAKKKQTVRFNV